MYTMDSLIKSAAVVPAEVLQLVFRDHNPDVPDTLCAALCGTCDPNGVNHDILAAQVALETGWWTSDFATARKNPAGLGAVDANPGDALSFDSLGEGFTAEVAHMLTYTDGKSNPLGDLDPRYIHVIQSGHAGRVARIGDLGNGVWATDPDYAGKIMAIANAFLDRYNGTQNGGNNAMHGYDIEGHYTGQVDVQNQNSAHSFDRGDVLPQIIVCHVTDGESVSGALTWNRKPDVEASSSFYIGKGGETVQDVPLNRAPWANGIVNNPSLPDWLQREVDGGLNPNLITISIEHVGKPDDEDFPTPEQWGASVRLSADLCDAFQIPVDRDHILGHYQFDSVNRLNCPGPRFDLDKYVRDVSELLNGPGDSVPVGDADSDSGRGVGTDVQPGQTGGSVGTGDSGKPTVAHPHDSPGGQPGRTGGTSESPTGHTIDGIFSDFYDDRYGYAISPVVTVAIPTIRGGQPTTVQWTERARLEMYTDADGTPHYSAGLLGYQDMERAIGLGVPVPGAFLGGAR